MKLVKIGSMETCDTERCMELSGDIQAGASYCSFLPKQSNLLCTEEGLDSEAAQSPGLPLNPQAACGRLLGALALLEGAGRRLPGRGLGRLPPRECHAGMCLL